MRLSISIIIQKFQTIEESLMNGEFIPIKGKQLEMIEKSLRSRRKDIRDEIKIEKL